MRLKAPEATLAQLEAIFRRLPCANGGEMFIPGIARELLIMRPVPPTDKSPFRDGLRAAAKAARHAADTIALLSPEAVSAFNFRDVRSLQRTLQTFAFCADEAGGGQGKLGAPKEQKSKIADAVGRHYLGVTGKMPGVTTNPDNGETSGPFIDTLAAVYEALDVQGSASAQAKRVAKAMKATQAKRSANGDNSQLYKLDISF